MTSRADEGIDRHRSRGPCTRAHSRTRTYTRPAASGAICVLWPSRASRPRYTHTIFLLRAHAPRAHAPPRRGGLEDGGGRRDDGGEGDRVGRPTLRATSKTTQRVRSETDRRDRPRSTHGDLLRQPPPAPPATCCTDETTATYLGTPATLPTTTMPREHAPHAQQHDTPRHDTRGHERRRRRTNEILRIIAAGRAYQKHDGASSSSGCRHPRTRRRRRRSGRRPPVPPPHHVIFAIMRSARAVCLGAEAKCPRGAAWGEEPEPGPSRRASPPARPRRPSAEEAEGAGLLVDGPRTGRRRRGCFVAPRSLTRPLGWLPPRDAVE